MDTSDNNLAAFRKKAGLTQRQLAEICGVSQPTIQRAEADTVGNTSYMLMMQIAEALKVKMERIWPSTALDVKQQRKVDDVTDHTLKVKLAGVAEPFLFPISAAESERLYRCVQDTEGFAVFTSERATIALRLDKVQWTNFLWDIPFSTQAEGEEESHDVQVWFEGDQAPTNFDAVPDRLIAEDDDDNEGAFDHMLFMLDSFGDLLEFSPVRFTDGDGEEVWINTSQAVLIRLDRSLHDQDLMRAEHEGYVEDVEAEKEAGTTH